MPLGTKTVLQLFFIIFISFFSQTGVVANYLQPVSSQPNSDYGYYQVGSSPSGADLVFDGKFVGETPITVPVFSSSTPGHIISVSKIGYITWTQSFSQNPVAGVTIQVFAPLQPTEATGSIKVTSSPSGALVTLDGTMAQMSPWIYTGVPVGGHIIQAFLSGYSPHSGQVEVVAGQTSEVHMVLYPLTSTGALQVATSPGGADLYVDSIFKGQTSTAVGSIATGTHVVLLKHYGYQDVTGDVVIEEGKTTYLSFTLTPFTEPTTGNLLVSSNPAGAGIYIDDSYMGVTHAGQPTTFTGIAAGPHPVELKLSNYQGYSETVDIVAGSTSTVSADLAASPSPSPFASLEISSVPSDASVFLDDTMQGITPLTLSSVPAGKHTISINMSGYSDYSTTMQLSPGQSALISVALSPIPTPSPTATSPFGLLSAISAPVVVTALLIMNRHRINSKK